MKTKTQVGGESSRPASSRHAKTATMHQPRKRVNGAKAVSENPPDPAPMVSPLGRWPILHVQQCVGVAPGGLSCEDAVCVVSFAVFKHRELFRAMMQKILDEESNQAAVDVGMALTVAEAVVRERVFARVAELDRTPGVRLPLPGLAGMARHGWRNLAVLLCAPLIDYIGELEEFVLGKVSADEAAELREALIVASQAASIEGAVFLDRFFWEATQRWARRDMAIAMRG